LAGHFLCLQKFAQAAKTFMHEEGCRFSLFVCIRVHSWLGRVLT